jgi:hypothetical protein
MLEAKLKVTNSSLSPSNATVKLSSFPKIDEVIHVQKKYYRVKGVKTLFKLRGSLQNVSEDTTLCVEEL